MSCAHQEGPERTPSWWDQVRPSAIAHHPSRVAAASFTLFTPHPAGIIWDKSGYIVTNYHCVSRLLRDKTLDGRAPEQVTRIGVLQADGSTQEYVASPVAGAAAYDLAVLKIDAPAEVLQPVQLTSSSSVRVGQTGACVGGSRRRVST